MLWCHFCCVLYVTPQDVKLFCATTICRTSSNMATKCYNVKKRDILRCSHFCCCVFCATAICHIFLRHRNLSLFLVPPQFGHTSSNMCYNVKKHFILQWRKKCDILQWCKKCYILRWRKKHVSSNVCTSKCG